MEEKELTTEESLALISSMIGQAKQIIAKGHSFYLILWGWVVVIGNMGHYAIARFDLYDHPYIVWLLIVPASIATLWKTRQLKKQAIVRGHYDRLYAHIWLAVTIGICVTLVFMWKLDFNHNPIILLFSAVGTYLSGQILRFNPLKIGALTLLVAAVIGFMLPVVDQYLIAGLAIIAGYLMPGYLLQKEEKRV